MLKRLLIATGVGALTLTAALHSAKADDYKVLHVSGYWTAYSARTPEGFPLCGMNASTTTGKRIYIKWIAGTDGIYVQLFKPTWRIPNNTKVSIEVGVDRNVLGKTDDAWGGMMKYTDGSGSIGNVIFSFQSVEGILGFITEFKEANKLWISFPGSTEPTWVFDATGSRDVGNAFAWCVNRTPLPTQPYSKEPEVSTQPFEPEKPKPMPTFKPSDRAA